MRVLVTGGSGYLGSLVCDELTKRGHYVVSVDLEPPIYYETPIAYIIDDFNNLSTTFVRAFDTVVHLAATTSVGACQMIPRDAHYNNETKTSLLYTKVSMDQHFVYASTSAIYGDNGGAAVKWDVVPSGSVYARTKYRAEILIEEANVAILRLATLWGYSPSLRHGIMIHDIIRDMREKGEAIVYDPETIRPYMNVRDCSKYIVHVVERSKTGRMNVGTETLKKMDIVRKLANVFDVQVEIGTSNLFVQNFRMPTRNVGRKFLENNNYNEAIWASAYLSRHSGEQIGQPGVSIKS